MLTFWDDADAIIDQHCVSRSAELPLNRTWCSEVSTPVTRAVWLGQVTVGLTGRIEAAMTPSQRARRNHRFQAQI
jgi:hypothetical protein